MQRKQRKRRAEPASPPTPRTRARGTADAGAVRNSVWLSGVGGGAAAPGSATYTRGRGRGGATASDCRSNKGRPGHRRGQGGRGAAADGRRTGAGLTTPGSSCARRRGWDPRGRRRRRQRRTRPPVAPRPVDEREVGREERSCLKKNAKKCATFVVLCGFASHHDGISPGSSHAAPVQISLNQYFGHFSAIFTQIGSCWAICGTKNGSQCLRKGKNGRK